LTCPVTTDAYTGGMKLQDLTTSLRFGPPVIAANLTMFPLLAERETAPGYSTLDEALAAGFVKVTEVSESGHVPELTITNDGHAPVLLLDGEELVGAKQNRIVNLTILVPPRTTLRLPVSCVEAGRWARRSRSLASAGRAHYASGRAMKVGHVSSCLRASGARRSDQGAIWDDIHRKAERMAAPSPTQASAAMYERSRADLDMLRSKLEALPGQVGAVFAIKGTIAGMDAFDSAATWRKSMGKIVESYGLDALDRAEPRPRARRDPVRFLASVGGAAVEKFPAVGLGEDLRLNAPRVAGAALAVGGEVVHVLAFAN
jgi:hypothetical protein